MHWISENYVCPNCVAKPDDKCCQNVPAGLFCTPDAKNRTEKTPQQLSQLSYCEAYRFISGIDEMALPCEMGLYFDFQNKDGFPTGCPGFAEFDGSQTEYWRTWSNLPSGKAGYLACKYQCKAEL